MFHSEGAAAWRHSYFPLFLFQPVWYFSTRCLYCIVGILEKRTRRKAVSPGASHVSLNTKCCAKKKKRSLEPQTSAVQSLGSTSASKLTRCPVLLDVLWVFFCSFKLTVPLEHSARAVQLVTLRHIRPRANANHAPEDICVVAGVQTGNSSHQPRKNSACRKP